MVMNETKGTNTRCMSHQNSHQSEYGGEDLTMLIAHLEGLGVGSGPASSTALLLVPTWRWCRVCCLDTLRTENHKPPRALKKGEGRRRDSAMKLPAAPRPHGKAETSTFWCHREIKKIWPLNISPKSLGTLQKPASFQQPRGGSLETTHSCRGGAPTQGHQVAVVLQHHAPVQVLLRGLQQPPLLPSEVHTHVHKRQWSLKEHTLSQSQILYWASGKQQAA